MKKLKTKQIEALQIVQKWSPDKCPNNYYELTLGNGRGGSYHPSLYALERRELVTYDLGWQLTEAGKQALADSSTP